MGSRIRHAFGALAIIASLGPSAPAGAQPAGDIAAAPLSPMLQSAVAEAVRAQTLEPARTQVLPLIHFPPQRGDLGRVCGEVREETPQGPRVRAFYASYARTGRVLARIEDMSLEDYLRQDAVFRNCGPRL